MRHGGRDHAVPSRPGIRLAAGRLLRGLKQSERPDCPHRLWRCGPILDQGAAR
jgi:hypothetical protein